MENKNQAQIVKDLPNKKVTITRNFNGPVDQVWKAWTDSKLLDLWWGPEPWRAETKSFEFKEGGHWLYAMVGPNGDRHWAKVIYKKIDANKSLQSSDVFSDENGNVDNEMPKTDWFIRFEAIATGTRVTVELSAVKQSDLEKLLEMGFEEGFNMGLGQLDRVLAGQVKK